MIAEILFTCPAHLEKAKATHIPSNRRVIWFVENLDFSPPQGVELRLTDFPRKGNLNGRPFLFGYMKILRDLQKEGVRHVIKRDSDTMILNLNSFIPPEGFAAVGVKHTRSDFLFWGCCYGLNLELALPVIEEFLKGPCDQRAEDYFIAEALKGQVLLLPNYQAGMAKDSPRQDWVFSNCENKRRFPV